MSGRKQHYIPQFLLRSFGEAGSGKKLQVRVFTSEQDFIVPTDGIATQREFYSKFGGDDVSLDDRITYAENEYFAIFTDLLECPANSSPDSRDVARLLVHLGVRGNHLRESAATACAYAMRRAGQLLADESYLKRIMGVGQVDPPPSVQKLLDNAFNERRAMLQKARISRHEFRRKMFAELNDKWDSLISGNDFVFSALAGMIDVREISREAHNDVLSKDMEPEKRVEILAAMDWYIRDWASPVFVLSDAIALAHDVDRAAMPAMFVGIDELQGVIFPLSPTRAVCSGVYSSEIVLETLVSNFPEFAARASWEFVVVPPSYGNAAVDSSLIGSGVGSLIYESIEAAMAESLAESFNI
jgi:hypothetical protein